MIDFDEPLALLFGASLHFVAGDLGALVAEYRRALVPGSVLALSHASADYPEDPELATAMTTATERFGGTESPLVLRDRAELRGLLAGLEVVPPGLVDVSHWDPGHRDGGLGIYGVVAQVPPAGAT